MAYELIFRTAEGLVVDRARIGALGIDLHLADGRWLAAEPAVSVPTAVLCVRLNGRRVTVCPSEGAAWTVHEFGSGGALALRAGRAYPLVAGDVLSYAGSPVLVAVAEAHDTPRVWVTGGSLGATGDGGDLLEEASGAKTFALTALAPDGAAAGQSLLLQAYFHLATQEAAVARIAAQKDRNAGARGTASIGAPLHDGDEVRITLSADGLAVDEPDQRLAWHGEPVAADFDVTFPAVPERSDYTLKIRAELNGAPVGTLKLRVAVTASAKARRGFVGGAAPARGAFHAYEYIFLSYASEDRARVLDVAQALDRLGVPFFQDVLSLRAGDDWETRIQAILPICDGFMLFWSKAAAASQWVMREAQMALALRRENADSGPDILPFILDQPPPHAPEALKAIHLNDPISCVRAALLR